MKAVDLGETTMKAGSYEGLSRFVKQFNAYNTTQEYAGDIEEYKVYKISS